MSDPFGIAKAERKPGDVSGAAIASGGAATAGVGLAAGGIPGVRSNVKDVKYKPGKGVKEKVRGRAKQAKALPGGVLGFRQNSHEGGIYGYKQKATEEAWKGPPKDVTDAFWRGRNAGKIGPEEVILRHLKGGKKAAGAALAGGVATTAYGLDRAKDERKLALRRQHRIQKNERNSDKYNASLLGGGSAVAGLSHGGSKLLSSQERKWEGRASSNIDEAGKMIPTIAGRERNKNLTRKQLKRGRPIRGMYASVSDSAIKRNPHLLKGVSAETAEKAGHLRGAAAQHQHFAEVYGDTAKIIRRGRAPGLIAAGAGAGGLAASRWEPKEKVKKSAFGVEHG